MVGAGLYAGLKAGIIPKTPSLICLNGPENKDYAKLLSQRRTVPETCELLQEYLILILHDVAKSGNMFFSFVRSWLIRLLQNAQQTDCWKLENAWVDGYSC